MSLPTLQDTLTLAPPVYLRIMDNRNDWGSPEDPIENRVTHAVKAIFLKRHKNPFSFYIVESDNDLRRIAMAYNANRHDPTDRMDFIAFLPEELKQAGLSGLQTPGGTECGYANRRHFDMEASEIQLASLCSIAMTAGRMAHRCPKEMMRSIMAEALEEHCEAIAGEQQDCLVEECSPQSPAA